MQRAALVSIAILLSSPAYARLIDFENGPGGRWAEPFGSFPAYFYHRVNIQDSDPIGSRSFVYQLDETLNPDAYFSGWYMAAGGYSDRTTWIEFDLFKAIEFSFDFASPSSMIRLMAWDWGGSPVFDYYLMGLDPHLNFPGGYMFGAGGFALENLGPLSRVRIEGLWNQALYVDNVRWNATPEPGTAALLAVCIALILGRYVLPRHQPYR